MKHLLTNTLLFLIRFVRKYYWFVLLISIVGYFLYQTTFSWDEKHESVANKKIMNEGEVVLLVVKEDHYGVKRNGFDSLSERLKTWDFDQENEKVYLKFDSLFPKDNTNVMLIYDRSFDSFQHYSEVLSISSFPYQYYFKNTSILTLHNVDKDGTVYLDYKGKQIKLSPQGSYPDLTFKGFQFVRTKIENHGVYQKEQFLKLKNSGIKGSQPNNENDSSVTGEQDNQETQKKKNEKLLKEPVQLPNINE